MKFVPRLFIHNTFEIYLTSGMAYVFSKKRVIYRPSYDDVKLTVQYFFFIRTNIPYTLISFPKSRVIIRLHIFKAIFLNKHNRFSQAATPQATMHIHMYTP